MDEIMQNTEETGMEAIEPVTIEVVEKKKDRKTKVKCFVAGAATGALGLFAGIKFFRACRRLKADRAARKAAEANAIEGTYEKVDD